MKRAVLLITLLLCFARPAAAARPAFFEIGFYGRPPKESFVVRVRDARTITEARKIISKKWSRGVMGVIVKRRMSWNSRWKFHLAPPSILFFELAAEVCDASPRYLQRHLDEIGGAFLPKNRWCPWTSYLKREVRRASAR